MFSILRVTALVFAAAYPILQDGTDRPTAPPIHNPAEFPSRIDRTDAEGLPEWASERALANPDGSVDVGAFAPSIRQYLDKAFASTAEREGAGSKQSSERCAIALQAAFGGAPTAESASIDDLAGRARLIVGGDVESLTPGLRFGYPGSIAAVKVNSIPKGRWASERLNVFVPAAKLRVRDRLVCFFSTEPAPQPGDELLVFVEGESQPSETIYVTAPPGALVMRSKGGAIRGPSTVVNDTRVQGLGADSPLSALVASPAPQDR